MNTVNGIVGNPKTRRKIFQLWRGSCPGQNCVWGKKNSRTGREIRKGFWKILTTHHKKFLPITETAPFAHSCWQARATGMDVWTNIKHKRKTLPIYEKQYMQVNQVACMVEWLVSNTQRRILSQKKSQKFASVWNSNSNQMGSAASLHRNCVK